MSATAMTVRLDTDTKKRFDAFASELGLPASTLVVALMRQAVRDHKVVLTDEPGLTPTPYLEDMLRQSAADRAADRVTLGPNSTAASAHLDSLVA